MQARRVFTVSSEKFCARIHIEVLRRSARRMRIERRSGRVGFRPSVAGHSLPPYTCATTTAEADSRARYQ